MNIKNENKSIYIFITELFMYGWLDFYHTYVGKLKNFWVNKYLELTKSEFTGTCRKLGKQKIPYAHSGA